MSLAVTQETLGPAGNPASTTDPYAAFVTEDNDGTRTLRAFVRNIVCAACVQRIERVLTKMPGVLDARVNMTTRRVQVRWRPDETDSEALLARLEQVGYPAVPLLEDRQSEEARAEKRLLRSMAVAGFAAANVMLLSVGVWAGVDMGESTRQLLHWVSAAVALPAVAYAGRPFFYSAFAALRARTLNMDVPISLAVLLAAGMSLVQTVGGGEQVYFDASVALLFFLLVGRYLDRRARGKAHEVGEQLLALSATSATAIDPSGARRAVPIARVERGMQIEVLPGDQVPVDGAILSGNSDIDLSLVNGETVPQPVAPGARVFAGTINGAGTLVVEVSGAGENTLLQQIVRLMEAAQQARSGYVRLADRAAAVYAPAVHGLALAAFLLWTFGLGAGAERGLLIAIATLIITCPCALGLAVPVVQVVASGRLFRRGILVKEGDALERIAAADTVVFDKTGTLTTASLRLANAGTVAPEDLQAAARLAAGSGHPLARALAQHTEATAVDVVEEPGMGLEHRSAQGVERLGSRAWCGVDDAEPAEGPELWYRATDGRTVRFGFEDVLRSDAVETVAALKRLGLSVAILSGDAAAPVARVAGALGVDEWRAACRPADKIARLEELTAAGHKVLMVGDGLNDAPALRAASVSMSPASAMYLSQTAADLVFQGDGLGAVVETVRTARVARMLILQNFGLAVVYNAIAIPLAVAGFVTPLIAAIAMSSSSLVVTLNALRLRLGGEGLR